jgi:predicted PurR-regulated permease PerM
VSATERETWVLVGLFVALVFVALVLLRQVIVTVFFAITVAYVLYPIRQWLWDRGVGRRVAAGLATTVAFLVGLVLLAPMAAVLYLRREEAFAVIRSLPDELTLRLADFAYTVDVASLSDQATTELTEFGFTLARSAPELALKAFLFTLLVYSLLLRPGRTRKALLRPVPPSYHSIVEALHQRVRSTLYAIYVLQAATAFGTFLVAYPLFVLLGYDPAFTLAALSGLLQFIPVVGPSVLILVLAGLAVVAGNIPGAVAVTVLGLVLIGFLPDALIRPRLAQYTLGMPGSLYFVGFVGGVLSVGVVGVIAGPLVVALLGEAAGLLADNHSGTQQRLDGQ